MSMVWLPFLVWSIAGIALLAWMLPVALTYARIRPNRARREYARPLSATQTTLDRLITPLMHAHAPQSPDHPAAPEPNAPPDKSGILLLAENVRAFAARAHAARMAERSLDLQYYYWKNDLVGSLLAREVIAAADRGVRVRLLIDDFNLRPTADSVLLALHTHKNIAVRVFNPSRHRSNPFHRYLEMALRLTSAMRRMHNKAWISDGRVAIVGGRNIGDEYFDAPGATHFQDLDLLIAGHGAWQAQKIFDRYWNSRASLPIAMLRKDTLNRLASLRETLATHDPRPAATAYINALNHFMAHHNLHADLNSLRWIEGVSVIADPPSKADGIGQKNWLSTRLYPLLKSARHQLDITSPYFIPGKAGMQMLHAARKHGTNVRILTNSLAATDVAIVHGAYARYRTHLLRAQIELYELRAQQRARISLFGSRTASLHTKAFLIDNERGFIGSFNFDPRSHSINTEMGVVFQDKALCAQITALFRQQCAPESAYRLGLQGERLVWYDESGEETPPATGPAPHSGLTLPPSSAQEPHAQPPSAPGASLPSQILYQEPDASRLRRLFAAWAGWLPIEAQL